MPRIVRIISSIFSTGMGDFDFFGMGAKIIQKFLG
jgi:hypothetical protein